MKIFHEIKFRILPTLISFIFVILLYSRQGWQKKHPNESDQVVIVRLTQLNYYRVLVLII